MQAKHPRTQARRLAGLSLAQAAAQIGLTPKAVQCFEVNPSRTFAEPLHRRRARKIYGAKLVPTATGKIKGAKTLRACAGCGKPITRAQDHAGISNKYRIKGRRLCSVKCAKKYRTELESKRQANERREVEKMGQALDAVRRTRPLTRAINDLVKLNQSKRQ